VILLLGLASAPAVACLPPHPRYVAPPALTVDQTAASIFRMSETIVYGELLSEAYYGQPGKFRVLRSYKGRLHAGSQVKIQPSWGVDPPMCAEMIGGPLPVPRGAKGVFAWTGEPELKWVSDEIVASMVKQGLVASSKKKQKQRKRS
ncbi:MAG: hypothetical protein VW891_07595, partial [Novosphingobium sp.]